MRSRSKSVDRTGRKTSRNRSQSVESGSEHTAVQAVIHAEENQDRNGANLNKTLVSVDEDDEIMAIGVTAESENEFLQDEEEPPPMNEDSEEEYEEEEEMDSNDSNNHEVSFTKSQNNNAKIKEIADDEDITDEGEL